MRVSVGALAAFAAAVAGDDSSTPPPWASTLRITASSTTRGGSKSYFRPESPAPSNAPPGFLWPMPQSHTSPIDDLVQGILDGVGNGGDFDYHYDYHFDYEDDDDSDDDDDDDDDERDRDRKITVTPFKRHWTVKLAKRLADGDASGGGVQVSVDASARTFVRAMSSSDTSGEDKLVAKVVVRGDAKLLVDEAVDVVGDAPSLNTSFAAFRVRNRADASSTPRSGRLLVQILLNTRYFHLVSLDAAGDSVVVVAGEDRLLSGSTAPIVSAAGRAALFVSLDAVVQTNAMTLHAADTASLVLQSMGSVSVAHLDLCQSQQATLAVVAQQIETASVRAVAEGSGRLCVHTQAPSASLLATVAVAGDDAVLEWTPTASSAGDLTCQLLQVSVAGRNARADTRGIQSQLVNATVMGSGAVAVVHAKTEIMYTASFDARGVAYVGSKPPIVLGLGMADDLHPVSTSADGEAFLTTSLCALTTLTRDFPLPSERAAIVSQSPTPPDPQPQAQPDAQPHVDAAPMHLPLEQHTAASTEQPLPYTGGPPPVDTGRKPLPVSPSLPFVDSSASKAEPDPLGGFVSSSLHRLGSMPYASVLVVFLASAWILHHLLQCYDRRQRRRPYEPLGERPGHADDRVWI